MEKAVLPSFHILLQGLLTLCCFWGRNRNYSAHFPEIMQNYSLHVL